MAGIILIFSLTVAANAEWELYFKSNNVNISDVYIDSSIEYLDKKTARVWIKYDRKKAAYIPELGKEVKARTEYLEFDCVRNRKRKLQTNALDVDDKVIWSSHTSFEWEYLSPDNSDSKILKDICNHDYWWRNK